MRFDDFVQVCYLTCGTWEYDFICDQWWVMRATCEHRQFTAKPDILIPEKGLQTMYEAIVEWHEENT